MFTLWPTTLIPESFAGGRGFRPASLISAAETEPLDDPPDDDEGTKLSLEVFRLGLLLERNFSWLDTLSSLLRVVRERCLRWCAATTRGLHARAPPRPLSVFLVF